MGLTTENALKLVSKAWGKQRGYVFFPWIPGDAQDKAQRIRGYNEGPAFLWPKERAKILAHLENHKNDDLYWCPSIFEKASRRIENAMDEHALWADLDEVDPRKIEDEFKPTIAWETSPKRFQALWLITGGDLQGASWPGNENQKLTYYLNADHSGWDTTQLLRLPGWSNHKPEYRDEDDITPEQGRLLWHNGPRYLPDHFTDLPEVRGAGEGGNLADDVVEDELRAIDRHEVWGRARLKVSKEVRELVAARSTGGSDRSDKLWQIERDLADAGLTALEIVAVVRETVWNKFAGRGDELKRLVAEAAKALGARTVETESRLEKEREGKPKPGNLLLMVKDVKPPEWIVKDILTKGSCGFFAGQPKSYKSFSALDLALSIATGAPFLNAFDVVTPGPVLYIQEEDPLPTLKQRLGKMLPGKATDKVTIDPHTKEMIWAPAAEGDGELRINAVVREGVTLSDAGWQAWLDEVLGEGYGENAEPYKLLLLDPLMMLAGDVEENKAQAMTEHIFKPLKQLAEKHQVSIQMVHHMKKTNGDSNGGGQARGGQLMLGSVANHAWSESSLYFTHGRLGQMLVETENKHATSIRFRINGLRARGGKVWDPQVELLNEDEQQALSSGRSPKEKKPRASRRAATPVDDLPELTAEPKRPGRRRDPHPPVLTALASLGDTGPWTTHEIKDALAAVLQEPTGPAVYQRAYQQLKRLEAEGRVRRLGKRWAVS